MRRKLESGTVCPPCQMLLPLWAIALGYRNGPFAIRHLQFNRAYLNNLDETRFTARGWTNLFRPTTRGFRNRLTGLRLPPKEHP